ncbi:MAG: HEAT repeat domain-containing protein [Chlamydiota bacterium]
MKELFIRIFLLFTILCISISASHPSFLIDEPVESDNQTNHLFFLIQNGQIGQAIDIYRKLANKSQEHDYQLLQSIGVSLLEIGSNSRNPEVQLVSLFGAGISLNEKTLHILEKGIRCPSPQHQLVSLNFLSKYHNEDATQALEAALHSDFLPIRLEAAFHLCLIKHSHACAQTESLMYKVAPALHPLFPQFFAASGTGTSIRILKQMLNNPNPMVRIQAINSAVKFERDEVLSIIRMLASHHDVAQQEACAFALGEFRDDASLSKLRHLAKNKSLPVRLSANRSMYSLGQQEAKNPIIEEARNGDVFAISLLADIPDTEETLFLLTQNENIHTRINAALALLQHKDSRALKPLCEILIKDNRDFAITPVSSIGNSLQAWKVVPSATQNFKETPVNIELSLNKREEALILAADLPNSDFLSLADAIFHFEQNDLVPVLVKLLENIQTSEAIALLKRYSQKAGAPLVRNYCNLALYRLNEEGPYYENLKNWILSKRSVDLIRFRPMVPLEKRPFKVQYQMTPEEESRLLVESFESFVQMQDDRGISILLQAIRDGNKNNKYVLAGLLIRATL